LYRPNPNVEKQKLNINISRYDNRGFMSKIINN